MDRIPGLACLVLGLSLLAAERMAQAATVNATVTVKAFEDSDIIRNDISRTTFGGGVEHQTPQFRTAMQTATATRAAFQSLNQGSFRFPNGTPGLFYYWDMPKESYISVGGVTKDLLLTPDEIHAFAGPDGLNAQVLVEVNTYQYLSPDFQHHLMATADKKVDESVLTMAADSAARWVEDNAARPASQRVDYWEVGNEDWVYWTPSEYATIFNAFGDGMKNKRPDIKLLAQSFTGDIAVSGKANNDYRWLPGLINGGIHRQQVYALSEHEYLSGDTFTTGSYDDQRIWQTQNMFAQIQNAWEVPYLQDVLHKNQLDWKIWMTEFNVDPKGPDGQTAELQDLGHALVVADWTGKMLEQGVERIFMHSLDHNPFYALVNYVNSGGTIDAPRFTVPGYAFRQYASQFGSKMVKNEIAGNLTLSSPNRGNYSQLAVYSSINESDPLYEGYPCMRIMVINRSTTDDVDLTINTANRPIAGPEKSYHFQLLNSPAISDSNKTVADQVKWSDDVTAPSSTAGIVKTLPKHSASFFIVPLQ